MMKSPRTSTPRLRKTTNRRTTPRTQRRPPADVPLVPHRREQHDLPERLRPGQDHHQTVDAEAGAAGRRHPLLQRLDEGLVVWLGLLVASRGLLGLRLESPALLIRVVELGERVGDLDAAAERLPALDQPLIRAVPLREGRQLNGVVDDEGGLDQLRLDLL